MFNFIIVTLFVGYGLILIFGLLRLARDLVTTPFPRLLPDADFEVEQDAIGQRPQPRGQP